MIKDKSNYKYEYIKYQRAVEGARNDNSSRIAHEHLHTENCNPGLAPNACRYNDTVIGGASRRTGAKTTNDRLVRWGGDWKRCGMQTVIETQYT